MRSLAFFVLILFLSGCSHFDLENPFERSVDEYGKTKVGAVTGATIGAGLGAIVGSASGNAGEGLAVGTLAGAAAGGFIGNQIEKNDEAMEEQSEALIRQEEMLTVQEREIQDLRASLDNVFPNNKPSRDPSVSLESYDGNPGARRWEGDARARLNKEAIGATLPRVERDIELDETSREQVLYRISPANAPSVKRNFAAPEVIEVAPTPKKVSKIKQAEVKPIVIARKSTPTKKITQVAEKKKPIIVAKRLEVKKAEKIVNDTVKKTENKATQQASKPAVDLTNLNDLQSFDANCMQAEDEAKRARKATSDADKLFYYRRALRLCATEPSYHVDIAKVYESIGRLDDARFEYNQAIQLDPDNTTANKRLAALVN